MNAKHRTLLLALTIGLALLAAACSDSDGVLNPNEGQVRFVVSSTGDSFGDAPATRDHDDGMHDDRDDRNDHLLLKSAIVTFSSILGRNLEGELINVEIDLPVSVDILSQIDGRSFTLPMGTLPPGTYDELVVVMKTVELVLQNDTSILVTPPGGGWTAIIPVCPFTVTEGGTTTVQIKFFRHRSFKLQNSTFHFEPHFECEAAPS